MAQEIIVQKDGEVRSHMAIVIVAGSLIGILILVYFTFDFASDQKPEDKREMVQYLLTAILPLIGTWMGTVLAFYFSRENFATASASVQNMVNKILTSEEKLKSILSREVMIKREQMEVFTVKDGQLLSEITIVSLLKLMEERGRSRLPILTAGDKLLFMFHRSTLDNFLVYTVKEKNDPTLFETLTLDDLQKNSPPNIQQILSSACGFVLPDSTLRDAKLLIDKVEACQDVMVTDTGDKNGKVLGWITNQTIYNQAMV